MKIQITEAVRRFNAQIELTDYALGLAAVHVADVRQLASLLSIAGHHDLRLTLLESAAELGEPGQQSRRQQSNEERGFAEMRTTLKQCRSVIGCLAWFGESPATLKSLKTTARIALDRINSIIPPSEI